MAFDPVPWFVGGGAEHSPEVARLLAFAATGGAEGVVTPAALRVVPLSTPGGGVQILPGAALIRSRAAGDAEQTYMARNATSTTVEVAATGSSGGRSDLIVVRVEDPFVAGQTWPSPSNPAQGPYVFARVVSGVPAGTTRLQDVPGREFDTGVAIARVDLPASTGTVTAARITDLRVLALARSQHVVMRGALTGNQALTSSTYVNWPSATFQVAVPEWANAAAVRIETLATQVNGNVNGDFQADLAGQVIATQGYNFDVASSGDQRVPILVAGFASITSSAGSTRTLRLRGRKTQGAGSLRTVTDGYYVATVTFYEVPV